MTEDAGSVFPRNVGNDVRLHSVISQTGLNTSEPLTIRYWNEIAIFIIYVCVCACVRVINKSIKRSPFWEISSHWRHQEITHCWCYRKVTMFTRAASERLRYLKNCNYLLAYWFNEVVTAPWIPENLPDHLYPLIGWRNEHLNFCEWIL
jgi:hypothetical protein